MNKFNAIVVMAGNSTRSKLGYNKAFFSFKGKPLYMHAIDVFSNHYLLEQLIVVANVDDFDRVKKDLQFSNCKYQIVEGGTTRFKSVKNALLTINNTLPTIIHDAARPYITTSDINQTLEVLEKYDATTFYHDIIDTIKEVKNQSIVTLDREYLKAVSTPQGFNNKAIKFILESPENNYYDELSILENQSFALGFLKETHRNDKFTIPDDFNTLERIGHSFDFHAFCENRKLILGGIEIPYQYGLQGHSDADVVYHAVGEAILGALGLGDLGTLFPDTDLKYKDIDSSYFLIYINKILSNSSYKINNIDTIIYLEQPNLKNYKTEMARNIALHLNISSDLVNVKATTMEKKGIIGSKEGIGAEAVVLLTLK